MQRIIDLKEKRVIVTGAGSGIGRETVRLLCREGAIVTAVDINGEGLVGTAADCGGACHTVTIDMTDATAVSEAVSQAVAEYGKLDGIVHCAGISSRKPLNVLSKEGFSKVMDVNFYSFVELVKQCTKKKHINDGASIVVMSSISSICGYKAKTEYCVSKAAVDAFVRCMALELADRHIRVNSVMPVGVDTPMGRKAAEMAAVAGNDSVANEPLVQPMEIANTIAFLLSDAAPSISGAAIPIMMPQQSAATPPHHHPLNDCNSNANLFRKRVLLVGDNSGINEAVCHQLVNSGAEVILYHPKSIDAIVGDVALFASECEKVDGVVFGMVHSDFRPLQYVTPQIVEQITTDNYGFFVELMRCLKKNKVLNGKASIVALSSISSIRAMKAKMAFCASKAALDAAVRCLAVELAPAGIRVNSLQKGIVDSDMEKSHIQDVVAVRGKDKGSNSPLGITSANEIANAVCFMLSDLVTTMTGTAVVIDGGYTA